MENPASPRLWAGGCLRVNLSANSKAISRLLENFSTAGRPVFEHHSRMLLGKAGATAVSFGKAGLFSRAGRDDDDASSPYVTS
jgi:hypothetical protein